MDAKGRIRWGILGTANIARASFLPGLHAGMVMAATAFVLGAVLTAFGVERH